MLVAEAFEVEVLEEDAVAVGDLARKTQTFTDEDDLEFLQPRARMALNASCPGVSRKVMGVGTPPMTGDTW